MLITSNNDVLELLVTTVHHSVNVLIGVYICYCHTERPDVPQNFTVDDVKRSSGGGWVTIKLSWIQPQNFDQFDIDHYDYSGTSTSGGQFKVTSPVTSTSGVRFNGTSPVHRAQITWSENPYNVPLITNFNIYITATSKCRETSPRYYASYSLELSKQLTMCRPVWNNVVYIINSSGSIIDSYV